MESCYLHNVKWQILQRHFLILLSILIGSPEITQAEDDVRRQSHPAGFIVLGTEGSAHSSPLILDIWYPADSIVQETPYPYGLGRGKVVEKAPLASGRFPVIVLSHGALGAARNYAWIAEHLARSGYLIVGVSHYGESYVYGRDTIDPHMVLQPWLRPPACSLALDYVLQQTEFQTIADTTRIGGLGHSSGGNTAIALGGATLDPERLGAYRRLDDHIEIRVFVRLLPLIRLLVQGTTRRPWQPLMFPYRLLAQSKMTFYPLHGTLSGMHVYSHTPHLSGLKMDRTISCF